MRAAWLVFFIALIARLLYVIPLTYSLSPDMTAYVSAARQIVAGNPFPPTLDRAEQYPLYIFYLAAHFAVVGENYRAVMLTQSLLGALTAVASYGLARQIAGDRRIALVAGMFTALFPDLIVLNGMLLTETLYTLLLTTMLLVWYRAHTTKQTRWSVIAGVLGGLALLTRTTLATCLPFALLWEVGASLPDWKSGLKRSLIIVMTIVLVCVPWLTRNWLAYQTPFPPSYQLSVVLWLSNHANADGTQTIVPASPDPAQLRGMSVAEQRARLLDEAVTWIRENPMSFLGLAVVKTSRLFGLKPDGSYRGVFFGKYAELIVPAVAKAILWILVLVGVVYSAHLWKRLGLIYGAFLSYWLTSIVFVPLARFLAPFIPALAVLAAYGLDILWRNRSRWRSFTFTRVGWLAMDYRARVTMMLLLLFVVNSLWDVSRNLATLNAWQNLDSLSNCDQTYSLFQCVPATPPK